MIVVDASVVIAALMADGSTRDTLVNTRHKLVAPELLATECRGHITKIAARTGLKPIMVEAMLGSLLTNVRLFARAAYAHTRQEAMARCEAAHAWGDDEYVALALALDAPVWTFDDDFARVEGVEVVGTGEVDDTL